MFKKSLALLLSLLLAFSLVPAMAEELSDEELKKSVESQIAELLKRNLVGAEPVEEFLKALNASVETGADGLLILDPTALKSNPNAYVDQVFSMDVQVSSDLITDSLFGYRALSKEKGEENYYGDMVTILFPEKSATYYFDGDQIQLQGKFLGMQTINYMETMVFEHVAGTEVKLNITEGEQNAEFSGEFPEIHFLKYYHNADSYVGQGFTITGTVVYTNNVDGKTVATINLDTIINYMMPTLKVELLPDAEVKEDSKITMKVLAKGVLEDNGKLFARFEQAPDTSIEPAN